MLFSNKKTFLQALNEIPIYVGNRIVLKCCIHKLSTNHFFLFENDTQYIQILDIFSLNLDSPYFSLGGFLCRKKFFTVFIDCSYFIQPFFTKFNLAWMSKFFNLIFVKSK